MSCWIPKGFFFFQLRFLFIVRVLKTKSIFTIVVPEPEMINLLGIGVGIDQPQKNSV